MTFNDIGSARESTQVPARSYADLVVEYLETYGYARVKDATIEGSLSDLVFRPVEDAIDARDLWVEVKATKASVADPDLAREVCDYLAEWLVRRSDARFRFFMFLEDAAAVRNWQRLFGAEAATEAMDWVRANSRPQHLPLVEANAEEVMSFFAEAEVFRASRERLGQAIAIRKAPENAGLRKYALDRLDRMERRAHAVRKNGTLVATMVPVAPPAAYVEIESSLSVAEVRELLRPFEAPPFLVLKQGRYLVPRTDDDERTLEALEGEVVREVDLAELTRLDSAHAHDLINQVVEKAARRRGCAFVGNQFIFIGRREVEEGRPRRIITDEGRLQVVKPVFERSAETDADEEDTNEAEDRGPLHHVVHLAFGAYCKTILDERFVVFRLHRAFSHDGGRFLRGSSASRLAARYRKALYNRALGHEEKVRKIAAFLFPRTRQRSLFEDAALGSPAWIGTFRFGQVLSLPTQWVPERVDKAEDRPPFDWGSLE